MVAAAQLTAVDHLISVRHRAPRKALQPLHVLVVIILESCSKLIAYIRWVLTSAILQRICITTTHLICDIYDFFAPHINVLTYLLTYLLTYWIFVLFVPLPPIGMSEALCFWIVRPWVRPSVRLGVRAVCGTVWKMLTKSYPNVLYHG